MAREDNCTRTESVDVMHYSNSPSYLPQLRASAVSLSTVPCELIIPSCLVINVTPRLRMSHSVTQEVQQRSQQPAC